jgi:hypothetical protein
MSTFLLLKYDTNCWRRVYDPTLRNLFGTSLAFPVLAASVIARSRDSNSLFYPTIYFLLTITLAAYRHVYIFSVHWSIVFKLVDIISDINEQGKKSWREHLLDNLKENIHLNSFCHHPTFLFLSTAKIDLSVLYKYSE